jgi:predicted outer membrane repeat protein
VNLIAVKLANNLAKGVPKTSGFGDHAYGGALYNAGTMSVTDCAFFNNKAIGGDINGVPFTTGFGGNGYGGAIYNAPLGLLNVTNSSFTGNKAIGGAITSVIGGPGTGSGGGFFNHGGDGKFIASSFDTNSADIGGAACFDIPSQPLNHNPFEWCQGLFVGNTAKSGGAIDVTSSGKLDLTNVTFDGNIAIESGGAINLSGGTVNIKSCTIVNNTATISGGGISIQSPTSSVANIQNTIVADNIGDLGPDIDGHVNSEDFNLVKNALGLTSTLQVHDDLGDDPGLGPLADNGGPTLTHLPQPGSPVVGVGNAGPLVPTDQRGLPRYVNILKIPNLPGDGSTKGAVEPQPPFALCQPFVTVPADASCAATIIAAQADNGSSGDLIRRFLSSYGPFGLGPHTDSLIINSPYVSLPSTCNFVINVVDTTPPTVVCPINLVVSLPPNTTSTFVPVNYPTPTAKDNCSTPTITTSPVSGSFFHLGTTPVTVTATDGVGNTAQCSSTVTVDYNFSGFLSPVDNPPTVNKEKAGRTIPINFSLSGNKGLNIFAPGYPISQQIDCVSGALLGNVEPTFTPGSSSLSYDPTTDTYTYPLKSDKAWAGTCRQSMVKLSDGTIHVLIFSFLAY